MNEDRHIKADQLRQDIANIQRFINTCETAIDNKRGSSMDITIRVKGRIPYFSTLERTIDVPKDVFVVIKNTSINLLTQKQQEYEAL